jgi:hypothetical protein
VDAQRLPRDLLVALAALAVAVAVVQALGSAWRRWLLRRTLRRRQVRAAAGEARAERMLRDLGYAVLGRQVPVSYALRINGDEVQVGLRADYVVGWGGRRYVAEVKTGRIAPRIDNSATRRQLLEYRLAFDVDGVLLVDADAGRVDAVAFPLGGDARPRRTGGGRLVWLAAGVALGAAAAVAAR